MLNTDVLCCNETSLDMQYVFNFVRLDSYIFLILSDCSTMGFAKLEVKTPFVRVS